MNLKKSNREGTGNTHKCLCCENLIPIYKKYCNRECYTNDKNVVIVCKKCNVSKKVPKNKGKQEYCSVKCANSTIDRKQTRVKATHTLKEKYGKNNPFDVKGYDNLNIDIK
jgi:hypothetical protein